MPTNLEQAARSSNHLTPHGRSRISFAFSKGDIWHDV
jgi:hypothetical protein